jgi:ABC-type glucose/galactose transport system permease subunit
MYGSRISIDLIISQKVKDSNTVQKDVNTQTTNPLNVFYAIHLLRTMIILPNINRLFVDRITGNPISRWTYTAMMHKKMQKMGIPPNETITKNVTKKCF